MIDVRQDEKRKDYRFVPYIFIFTPIFLQKFHFREKKLKRLIEEYRKERPKIQQEFSDLKVLKSLFII